MSSQIKTLLLLSGLTGLMLFLGQAMGGRTGLFVALGIALIMNLGSYWFSDKIVLSMYRARELAFEDAPYLHQIIEQMAAEAGIPKPRIYLIPEEAPNAFATGRDPSHAAVAVTSGIMRLLTPEELRGVLAHELGHVLNRDILIQTVAAVLGGAITFMANMLQWGAIFGGARGDDEDSSGPGLLGGLLMAILAPIAASLIQMAISRSREYLADASGARLSHDPLALASALSKIEAYSHSIAMPDANPATAHMFIINPLSGESLANLFSTHPPTAERIRRLREMAGYK